MQLKVLVVHNLQGLKRGSFVFTQENPELTGFLGKAVWLFFLMWLVGNLLSNTFHECIELLGDCFLLLWTNTVSHQDKVQMFIILY